MDRRPRIASNLLLREADGGAPILDAAIASERAGAEARPDDTARRGYLWNDGKDPEDLALQRWGVIAPEGPEGDALLGAIGPLIAAREREQGAPVRIDRLPPGMDAPAVLRWRRQHFDRGDEFRDDLPRYQLILGDLHQISPEVQMIQAASGYLGRLAFDALDDYRAYVDKLLAWEARPREQAARRLTVHTVHDGSAATTVAARELIAPGLARLRDPAAQQKLRGVTIAAAGSADPPPDELAVHARVDDPGVFFTLSHGEGAPRRGWRSAALQRQRQGAMSFGAGGSLGAAEVSEGTWMPGALWMMFACFSAGTPKTSKFERWLRALAGAGEFAGDPQAVLRSLPQGDAPPFVAALPKAALAGDRGPLAFIGHLDLAWTYGFRELHDHEANARPARFMAVLRAAITGARFGVAFRELYRYFEEVNTELAALEGAGIDDPGQRGHLWMLRQDLAGYVLLGDPAARLPIRDPAAREAAAPAPAPAASVDDFFGFGVRQAPAPAAAPVAIGIDVIEEALAAELAGGSIDAVARARGVERRRLQGLVDRYREAGRRAIRDGDGDGRSS